MEIIRLYAPTSLPSGYEMSPPALTGCLGGFSTRTDRFLVDLLKKYDANLESYPDREIIRGYCRGMLELYITNILLNSKGIVSKNTGILIVKFKIRMGLCYQTLLCRYRP